MGRCYAGKSSLTALEQHVMLAVMALQPEAYSAAIVRHIGRHTGFSPSIESVCVALAALKRFGFVTSRKRCCHESTRR
jgi:hypothetical protein